MLRTPLDAAGVAIYALTALALALLMHRKPACGIAALVLVVPFGYHRFLGPTTITLFKAALAGAAAGLAWRRPSLVPLAAPAARALGMAGAAVAAATALSILPAEHRGPALREALKALEYLALFAVRRGCGRRRLERDAAAVRVRGEPGAGERARPRPRIRRRPVRLAPGRKPDSPHRGTARRAEPAFGLPRHRARGGRGASARAPPPARRARKRGPLPRQRGRSC